MSGPSGNQLVLFSLESDVSLDFISGKHQDSQENRLRKYTKFDVFYAKIVQMTPQRLRRESLQVQKFLVKTQFCPYLFTTNTIDVNCKHCKP